jgi:hypothetical protein
VSGGGTAHWSAATPDRVVTMPRSEQQPVLLDPRYGILGTLAEVARLAQQLDITNVIRSAAYQRDYMVAVILVPEFLAAGGVGAFAFLPDQEVPDFRERVLAFCFFPPRSTIGRVRSRVVLVSGSPCGVMFSDPLRVLFCPLRDACFFTFWISFCPGKGFLDGLFTSLGIRATAVNKAAFFADHCFDKSLCHVPVDAGYSCEIPLPPIVTSVFSCDKRANKRQTGESHSGAPIARKVRGVVALERCHASSFYIDNTATATVNEASP